VTYGDWNVILTCVFARVQILDKARQTVMAKTGGKYPAPFKILDAIEVGACSFIRKDRIPRLVIWRSGGVASVLCRTCCVNQLCC
jgi:hypothetical protein